MRHYVPGDMEDTGRRDTREKKLWVLTKQVKFPNLTWAILRDCVFLIFAPWGPS